MPKVLRVTLGAFHFGQNVQNRLHFLYRDDSNLAYLQDMIGQIEGTWIPAIRPAINGECVFQSIRVDDLSAGPLGPTLSKQIAIPGSAGNDAASPPFFSVVLQLQNGSRGRRNRGRIMMPGQSPGQFSNGLMNSLGQARWTTPVHDLSRFFLINGADNGSLLMHLILSSGNHGLDQVREITTMILRTTPGSQNSRKFGVGA